MIEGSKEGKKEVRKEGSKEGRKEGRRRKGRTWKPHRAFLLLSEVSLVVMYG
jgi:hypothetical protein